MRHWLELSTTIAPSFWAIGLKYSLACEPALNNAISTSVNIPFLASSTNHLSPRQTILLPTFAAMSNGLIFLIGKVEDSIIPNISLPTAPRAPTTAIHIGFLILSSLNLDYTRL